MHAIINIRHKSNKGYIIFLMHNFAINIIYINIIEGHLLKKPPLSTK